MGNFHGIQARLSPRSWSPLTVTPIMNELCALVGADIAPPRGSRESGGLAPGAAHI